MTPRIQALAAFQVLSVPSSSAEERDLAAQTLQELLGVGHVPTHPGVFPPGESLDAYHERLAWYLVMRDLVVGGLVDTTKRLTADYGNGVQEQYLLHADGQVCGDSGELLFTVVL